MGGGGERGARPVSQAGTNFNAEAAEFAERSRRGDSVRDFGSVLLGFAKSTIQGVCGV